MSARVLVAGLWHETNTFSTLATGLDRFRAYQHAGGPELIERYRGTETEIGGMIEGAAACGLALVPALFAAAVPSGTVTAAAFEHLAGETCRRAAAAAPLAGALVALHGAMVAEGAPEADALFLRRLRAVLGPRAPIVATFDMHANLSPALVETADVLVGYDTFPHVDFAARGHEAAAILARLVATPERPARALRKLPLVTVPQRQVTHEAPMDEVMAAAHALERDADILCISVAQGFAYADVDHLGVGVVAYGRRPAVDRACDRLAAMIWAARDSFLPELLAVEAGVDTALSRAGPTVLAEPADNVGGGAPGDGMRVIDALLRRGAPSAAAVVWDPAAVTLARSIGVGGTFDADAGGKTVPLHGPPARLRGRIVLLDEVTYTRTGSYMRGQRVPMGEVAVVDCGGVAVVLTGERVMPFDADHLRAVGVHPEGRQVILAKSGSAWRAAFGDLARHAAYVDTPGVCASNVERLPYSRPRALYPLDRDVVYPAPRGGPR